MLCASVCTDLSMGSAQGSPSCAVLWRANSWKDKASTASIRITFLFLIGADGFADGPLKKPYSSESLLDGVIMALLRISSAAPSKTSAFCQVLGTLWSNVDCSSGVSPHLCSLQASLAPARCWVAACGSQSDGFCFSDPMVRSQISSLFLKKCFILITWKVTLPSVQWK